MKKIFGWAAAAAFVLLFCNWGFLVHRTTAQLAVYQLPASLQPFFFHNMDYLVYHSVRPDVRRNTDSTEATKHFIDLEVFGDSAAWNMPCLWNDAVKKYSRDTLLKYGYVPYVVTDMQKRLTEAFRRGQKDSILFYAADLSHYIGDANVPLHTSLNYDGQLTGQKGLHSLWESTIPELHIKSWELGSRHQARYIKDPAREIWKAIRRANALVNDMLAREREVSKQFTDSTKYRIQVRRGRESRTYSTAFARAYAAALKNTVNEQLIFSSNLIADFWYTAWVDAGKPDLARLLGDAWNESQAQKLKTELEAFRQNKLVEQNLLHSVKQSGGE